MSDGHKVYSHIPADKQVIVTTLPPDDEATTPALFLAGKGDIARDFTATYVESGDRPGTDDAEAHSPAARTGVRIPHRLGGSGHHADPGIDHARPPGGRFGLDV